MQDCNLYELRDNERFVFHLEGNDIDVECIVGDPQFHPNTRDVFKYKCEFGMLTSIVDHIVNGTDGSEVMHKYLGSEGKLTIMDGKATDYSGRIFSKLERAVLTHETFDGFVEPSIGTVWRFQKVKANLLQSKIPFTAYYIAPSGYPNCDDRELWKFNMRREEINRECVKAGMTYFEKIVTWDTIPERCKLYFGSLGWKINELGLTGIGLEMNPDMAAVLNLSMIDCTEHELFRKIKYVKNNWVFEMKYFDEPIDFRIHGADYMRLHALPYDSSHSIFNVVTNKMLKRVFDVRETDDLFFGHCSRRIIVPKITSIVSQFKSGTLYKFGCCVINNEEVICDILAPAFDLTTRTKILRKMGYYRPEYSGKGDFTVLSSIGSCYLNFVAKSDNTARLAKYNCGNLDFPSAWYYTGSKWKLRAYPDAIRAKIGNLLVCELNLIDYNSSAIDVEDARCIVDDECFVLIGEGAKFVRFKFSFVREHKPVKKEGKWHTYVNDVWTSVPVSEYYDANLIVKQRRRVPTEKKIDAKSPQEFFVAGSQTLIYFEDPKGVEMIEMRAPKLEMSRLIVTIKKKHDIYGNDISIMCSDSASKITTYDDCKVFTFSCEHDAFVFFKANNAFRTCIWYGDLRKGYEFPDPMAKGSILVPKLKLFIDSSLFSFPLAIKDILSFDSAYDPVGNYFAESSGQNAYDVYDFDEDIFEGNTEYLIS